MAKTCQVYRLSVPTNIYMLSDVQRWFESLQQTMPQRIWMQCNLVLVEAFTNVVYHAHTYLPEDTPIDIECQVDEEGVELRVWDQGEPFDMEQQIAISLQQHADYKTVADIPTGGRGLIIAHSIADRLSYQRFPDQRNCFIFYKALPKE
ncbi:MAG: ATP-binding protein [Pseudanabaenaceae cyanobacterium]